MPDLRNLYQEVVFDHNRHPRNFGKLSGANRRAEGFNPLCGDKMTVYLHLEDGRIRDVRFEGVGCAISMASASLMTESLKGKSEAEADALFQGFHELLTGQAPAATGAAGQPSLSKLALGKLEVLGGVREYPSRVKCATLAWHAMNAALKASEQQAGKPVTTE
jgi:nitrogen fixation NifU-like protein